MQLNEIYKCNICGNIIELTHVGTGDLSCCGQPMIPQEANTIEAATEKHIPVIEKTSNGYLIKVGEVEHPMNEDHFIEWIEVITENKIYRKYLKPGEKPEFQFCLSEEILEARSYCNLHRLWKK